MRLAPRALWTVCLALSMAALVPALWSSSSATTLERSQRIRLDRCVRDAQTIADLASALPSWTRTPTVNGTLAPAVGAVLAAAGLPPATMTSLSAEADIPAPGANATFQPRTRRATLVLSPLTLPQVGSFLQRWRERQPAWTIVAIDLAPEAGAGSPRPVAGGGDLPLHVVLTLDTITMEVARGTR